VAVVVVERGVRFRPAVPRPVHRVDKQYVLPAVVVVVDKRAARPDGLRQILLAEGSTVVFETNPRLRSDISELNRAGVAWRVRSLRRLRLSGGLVRREILLLVRSRRLFG